MSGLQSVFRPLAQFRPPSRALRQSSGTAGHITPRVPLPPVFPDGFGATPANPDGERIEACKDQDDLDAALDETVVAESKEPVLAKLD